MSERKHIKNPQSHRVHLDELRPKKTKEFVCKVCYNMPHRVVGGICTDKIRYKKPLVDSRRAIGPIQEIRLKGCGIAYQEERISILDTEMTLIKTIYARDDFYLRTKK